MIIQVINISENDLPKYETKDSAGMDVRADFSRVSITNPIKVFGNSEVIFKGESHEKTMLKLGAGSRALIPTGLKAAIPDGNYEIQVRPRSGLSLKKGLTCANAVGTIDADYRNEIGVILINLGQESVWIEDGERIAQLILNKVDKIEWNEVGHLDETTRKGGFGSTGVK